MTHKLCPTKYFSKKCEHVIPIAQRITAILEVIFQKFNFLYCLSLNEFILTKLGLVD